MKFSTFAPYPTAETDNRSFLLPALAIVFALLTIQMFSEKVKEKLFLSIKESVVHRHLSASSLYYETTNKKRMDQVSTKAKILDVMKQAPDTVFSGEKLAQLLDISRTSIWKAIRELEKEGYRFEHLKTGYLYKQSDVLATTDMTCLSLPKEQIYLKKRTDSTMNDAKNGLLAHVKTPALFVSEAQDGGHGRFNRPFFSPEGQIYMSLILEPNQTFEELPQYTLLAAVALSLAIDELTGLSTEIKWVNDIYLNGKKICGILSEATSDIETGQISSVTIGIGINFSIDPTLFPEPLQKKATSLFKGQATSVTRNQLIQLVWQNFFDLIAGLPDQSYMKIYRQKSLVLNREVSFIKQQVTYTGIARDITNQGELIVDTPQQTFSLSSGEISLTHIDNYF